MNYKVVNIAIENCTDELCDIITAVLTEIGFDSFEIKESGVDAYIEAEQFDETSLNETLEVCREYVSTTYTVSDLEQQDWNAVWEAESFDPVLERDFGIRLNPRMAFGSGSHETTYQITETLMSEDFTGKRVLDMGTGTGVLAIAMSKKNASEVVAIDIDQFSVDNAKENAALNSCDNIAVILGDASVIEGMFDVIVANIHKNILLADMATYVAHLNHGGELYMSGFFTADAPDILSAAESHGLKLDKQMAMNDWCVVKLNKL